ncbi:MAG: hypothetical protein HY288_20295 [Planctomycetia bacterium]|nr:hypothetical protein [Planctomycetia bacterium]
MTLRHDRRRLLFTEDSPGGGPSSPDDGPIRIAPDTDREVKPAQRAYATAARFDRQRRIHDLLPARYLAIALVVATGLLLVGGIELLHVWAGSLARFLKPEDTAPLELTGTRNISQWFASMLLGVIGLAAIFIYSLRRHRVDDYHGRYRIWLWTAMACMLVSLGETTDLVLFAQGVGRRVASDCGLAEGIVWPSVLGIVLTVLGIRMVIEIRACRAALATLALGTASFLAAAAVEHGWLMSMSESAKPLVARGCWLVGYVFTFGMFLLYARHVMLEIEGLAVVPPSKSNLSKPKSAANDGPEPVLVDPPQKAAPLLRNDLGPVQGSSSATGSSSRSQMPASKPPSADSNVGAARFLSRAERRRLRKEAKAQS